MCTPSTLTRLARWRLRNWTSMFCACRFSLEEEQDACTSLPQASTEAMFAVTTGSCKPNKRVSKDNRFNRARRERSRDSRSPDSKETDNGNDDSRWPRFAEEDYIVFCFGEDGTFDVMKDGKSGTSDHINCVTRASRSSSRPVNRKLIYGENEERDNGYSSEEIYQTYDGDCIIFDKEGEEEEESIYMDPVSPDEIQGGDEIEENEDGGTVHLESIYSNQSDDSSGSFAFPVLRWEGFGSPVQMPRNEDLRLRKHKGRGLGFHCCRF